MDWATMCGKRRSGYHLGCKIGVWTLVRDTCILQEYSRWEPVQRLMRHTRLLFVIIEQELVHCSLHLLQAHLSASRNTLFLMLMIFLYTSDSVEP
jgi:hypothetical protein